MGRLTTNKDVQEMGMYELAHNCCYVKDGLARYRNFNMDIDAREFARKLYRSYVGDELPEDEGAFDECMLDNLMFDAETEIDGLIAYFYHHLWAMADLREKLKQYEDITPEPEKLIEIDKWYSELCRENGQLKKELAEYKRLEDEALPLRFPCKRGDIVWTNDFGRPYSFEVTGFSFGDLNDESLEVCDKVMIYYRNSNGSIIGSFAVSELGKTVFLTKEEAERALK